jgi:hypothetical protein
MLTEMSVGGSSGSEDDVCFSTDFISQTQDTQHFPSLAYDKNILNLERLHC